MSAPSPAAAQARTRAFRVEDRADVASGPQTMDSLYARGRQAGSAAARQRSNRGRFFLAFGGGLLVGFFGPLSSDEEIGLGTPAKTAAILGGGTVAGAMLAGSQMPKPEAIPSEAPEVYRKGFTDGYSSTLRGRRFGAALTGGVGGALFGIGTLVGLIASAGPFD